MGRLGEGFRALGIAFRIVRMDPELLLIPVLTILTLALVDGALALLWLQAGVLETEAQWDEAVAFLTLYIATAIITVYYNAAIVAEARIRFGGTNPTLRDGLSAAWARKGVIVQWAIVASVVGLLIRILRDRARGPLGGALGTVAELGWAAATFLVVPILVYEGLGPMDSIRKSVSGVKKIWAEGLVGVFSLTIVNFVVALPVVLLAVALFQSGTVAFPVALALVAIWIALVTAVTTSARGVLQAAVYEKATTGRLPDLVSATRLGGEPASA